MGHSKLGEIIQFRPPGKTGLDVSVIGLGAAMPGSSEPNYALKVVKRAIKLGVNYIDTARNYWDSEVQLGHVIKNMRKQVHISRARFHYLLRG